MAGDVQQPFSLSFQVDALHSSSISFGRFELESLSWERKSSFSHNRYLEEVEKCAKPGSVTEKKAYFEAHFRKRALLRQASSVSQAEIERTNSDSSSYSTITCDENHRDLMNGEDPKTIVESSNVCQFDESPKGSSCDEDFRVFEYEAGIVHNQHSESSLNRIDPANEIDNILKGSSLEGDFCGGELDNNVTVMGCSELKLEPILDKVSSVENVKCHDGVEPRESDSTLDQILVSNVEHKLNLESEGSYQNSDVKKEKCISRCTVRGMIQQPSKAHTLSKVADKTRSSGLGSRLGGDASLTCGLDVKKGFPQTEVSREKQTPLKAQAQKQTSRSIRPNSSASFRQLKENPQNMKPESPQENRSVSEKELRPKRTVTPQPSTPEKSEYRRQRPATSSTRRVASTRKEMGQSEKNYSFRNNGGTEKKREKILAADIKKSSRMPDMKEKQELYSVSNAAPQLSNIQKPKASERTVQSENHTTASSKPSSVSRVKQVVSFTKSGFKRETDNVQKIIDTNSSASTRNHVIEAKQRKEVINRHEGQSERKPKARENVQTMKGKIMVASNKDTLGKGGHSFLRKSSGHNSCVAVTTTEAPKLGSGRKTGAFLRKSMGC